MTIDRQLLLRILISILFVEAECKTVLGENNQWNSFGPIGGSVSALAVDPNNPNTLYASTFGGVFRTTDGGANWRALHSSSAPGRVTSIVVDPHDSNNVYAAAEHVVFKSTDGGTNWASLTVGSSWLDQGWFWTLALDSKHPNTLYAGSANEDGGSGGLLKSTDGGTTWRRAPLSENAWGGIYVYSVTIDPQDTEIVYAGTTANLYQSTDGGLTWKAIAAGGYCLAIDPANPTTLYTGTEKGIFKSTDRGSSWNQVPGLPMEVGCVKINPHNSRTVYASIYGWTSGLQRSFKSIDGGVTWAPMSGSLPDVIPTEWDPNNPDTIYHARTDGLFKSVDAGTRWRRLYSGLALSVVDAVVVDPKTPGSVYAFAWDGVFKSTDGARRWRRISSNSPRDTFRSVAIDPQNPRTFYAAKSTGFYKSTDGGVSWSVAGTELPSGSVGILAVDPQTSDTVFAVVLSQVSTNPNRFKNWLYKSIDGGTSWIPLGSANLPDSITVFAVNPQRPENLFVGSGTGYPTSIGPLYRSTDGGSTWSNIFLPMPPGGVSVRALAFDPQNSDTVFAIANGTVLKSTDGGTTWTRTSAGTVAGAVGVLKVDPTNSNVLFAGTDRGLWKSMDGGATWHLEDGVPQIAVTDLTIERHSSKVYAATNGGGVFATFDPPEQIPVVPLLTLDSTGCIGQAWSLKVNAAQANAAIHLFGNSNGQAWETSEWSKTDVNGSYEARGTFAKEAAGRHTLYVDVDGATSNDVSFRVTDCLPSF